MYREFLQGYHQPTIDRYSLHYYARYEQQTGEITPWSSDRERDDGDGHDWTIFDSQQDPCGDYGTAC